MMSLTFLKKQKKISTRFFRDVGVAQAATA
jgi:hypothetical protein